MTSFRQVEANRRNALKSTGPLTTEGKQKSRRNAVRHGLTAETVIGALEDAEDYSAFEAAIIADYDAQSAVERELLLRLASLLWRLRRATTMETGLFDIQTSQLEKSRQRQQIKPKTVYVLKRSSWADTSDHDVLERETARSIRPDPPDRDRHLNPSADLATCFLSLANLPSYALDRLSRYEAILWRQTRQILFALDALARRKPQERGRYPFFHNRRGQPFDGS